MSNLSMSITSDLHDTWTGALGRLSVEQLAHLDALLRGEPACPCFATACLVRRDRALEGVIAAGTPAESKGT